MYYWAKSYYDNEHYSTAADLIEKNLLMEHSDTAVYFLIIDTYVALQDWDNLFKVLQNAANKFPDDLRFRHLQGKWYLTVGKVEEAKKSLLYYIEHYQKGNNENSLALIHGLLGMCYIEFENWEDAQSCANAARTISPGNLDACRVQVEIFYNNTQNERIPNFLEDFIKENPSVFPPYLWLAQYYHSFEDQPEQSLTWYEKTLETIEFGEKRGYYFRYESSSNLDDIFIENYLDALLLCQKNDEAMRFIESLSNFNRLFSAYPKEYWLVIYNILIKEYELAEEVATRYLENIGDQNTSLSAFWAFLAYAQTGQGKRTEATESINKALSFVSISTRAYNTIASVQMSCELWEDALGTYKTLIDTYQLDPYWFEAVGKCHFELDDFESAANYFQKALKYEPKNIETWEYIESAYRRIGKVKLADQTLEKIAELKKNG